MSKEVLNTRQRVAGILYKLAIRNMQLAYRTLYTEKDRADLGGYLRKTCRSIGTCDTKKASQRS